LQLLHLLAVAVAVTLLMVALAVLVVVLAETLLLVLAAHELRHQFKGLMVEDIQLHIQGVVVAVQVR
jgi:hypothetical protein